MSMIPSWRDVFCHHAETDGYQAALEASRKRCEDLRDGSFYVAYSGGKDSLVCLDLLANRCPPVIFYDFGMAEAKDANVVPDWLREEVYQTVVIDYGLRLEVVTKYRNFTDGPWAHWPDANVATIPSDTFWLEGVRVVAEGWGWTTSVVGLRRQESVRRRHRIDANRWIAVQQEECWPVAEWSEQDIWAYIASKDLPYSSYYDRCAEVTGSYEGLRMTSLFQDGTKGIEDGLHGVEFWRDRPHGGA